MPKRISKRTKRKTRRVKKKAKISYRKKYRKALRYHKKSMKKHYKKKYRKRSSIYQQKQQVGIKFTRYLDLLQFLTDPWIDCMPMLASAANQDDKVIGNNYEWTADFQADIRGMLNDYLTVYSTDIMHGDGLGKDVGFEPGKLKWKAWNPTPQTQNLGLLFDLYTNMYKKFKWTGVKVKWIPYCKNNPHMQLPTESSVYTVGHEIVPTVTVPFMHASTANAQAGSETIYGFVNDINVAKVRTNPVNTTFEKSEGAGNGLIMSEHLPQFDSALPGFKVSPVFRLWINFSKNGYEPKDLEADCIKDAVASNTSVLYGSRFNDARVLDSQCRRLDVNTKLTRSYLLNKSFKFFVKPKMARTLEEGPKNSTVLNNFESEFEDTEVPIMLGAGTQIMKTQQTGIKMPWLSVFSTRPENALDTKGVQNDATHGKTRTQALVQIQLLEKYWFDPILFGWLLTCDNMPINAELPLCRIMQVAHHADSHLYKYENYKLQAYDYFHQMGRFKVTYYCKFKGLKNTNFNIPAWTKGQENADMEIET